jgi:hypothetical protein
MKTLLIALFFLSTGSYAQTSAECVLVDGIYQNSPTPISDIRFETVVDIFTLNNARALTMNLDGKNLRFLRSEMDVGRQTKMIYLLKKNKKAVRAVHLMIDRSPKEVSRRKEFYGNMIISPEVEEEESVLAISDRSVTVYNFYCSF